MTDKFNLKKNKQLKNIVRSEEPTSKEEETIINNVNCDHKNGCDHVLTNGALEVKNTFVQKIKFQKIFYKHFVKILQCLVMI